MLGTGLQPFLKTFTKRFFLAYSSAAKGVGVPFELIFFRTKLRLSFDNSEEMLPNKSILLYVGPGLVLYCLLRHIGAKLGLNVHKQRTLDLEYPALYLLKIEYPYQPVSRLTRGWINNYLRLVYRLP